MDQLQIFTNGFFVGEIRSFVGRAVAHQVLFDLQDIGGSFVNRVEDGIALATQPGIPGGSYRRNAGVASRVARGGSSQICVVGQVEETTDAALKYHRHEKVRRLLMGRTQFLRDIFLLVHFNVGQEIVDL